MFCDKVAYDSHNDAQAAIRDISIRKKTAFRVYTCTDCSKHHITSIRKKKLKPQKDWTPPEHIKGQNNLDAQLKKFVQTGTTDPRPLRPAGNARSTYTIGDAIKFKNQQDK